MKRKTYEDIMVWVKTARHGQEVVYYTGFLMKDRKSDKELSFKADRALRAFETRLVILFQRKVGVGVYEYVAKRTRKKCS